MADQKSIAGSPHVSPSRGDRLVARNGKKARALRCVRWNYLRQVYMRRNAKKQQHVNNIMEYDSDVTIPYDVSRISVTHLCWYDSESTNSLPE